MLNLPVHGPPRPRPLIRSFERYVRTVTQPWFAMPLFVATADLLTDDGAVGSLEHEVIGGQGADKGLFACLLIHAWLLCCRWVVRS
jgi:hypothetical protein